MYLIVQYKRIPAGCVSRQCYSLMAWFFFWPERTTIFIPRSARKDIALHFQPCVRDIVQYGTWFIWNVLHQVFCYQLSKAMPEFLRQVFLGCRLGVVIWSVVLCEHGEHGQTLQYPDSLSPSTRCANMGQLWWRPESVCLNSRLSNGEFQIDRLGEGYSMVC